MPTFSPKSLVKLSLAHEDLQKVFNEVIKVFDCTILESFRDQQVQDIAFNNKRSKLIWPKSKHNKSPSFAIDAAPFPVDWNDYKRWYYFGGLVMGIATRLKEERAITHGIRWGGDWGKKQKFVNNSFNDLPHFELLDAPKTN